MKNSPSGSKVSPRRSFSYLNKVPIITEDNKNNFPQPFTTYFLRDVFPLLGPVGPGALPLCVVAPRVPDADEGEEALLPTRVDLGTDNLSGKIALCTVLQGEHGMGPAG